MRGGLFAGLTGGLEYISLFEYIYMLSAGGLAVLRLKGVEAAAETTWRVTQMTSKQTSEKNRNEARFWSTPGLFLQEFGMLGVFALTLILLLMSPMIIHWLS